ncbi:MAG: hypothetical protein JSW61_07295 [Candidatus Thorarchaeota archaeon]|nr:MAG: hypothetical protein JSW61_07295 [Candidatus Thorarchaeota archaeon]
MIEESRSKRTVFGRTFAFLFVFLAWITNSVLRLCFAYMSVTGVQLLDIQVSQLTIQILNLSFVSLGVVGLLVSVGLWLGKRWGLIGAAVVSVATIIFDIWGMTLQFTAALGFIVPALVLGYIMVARTRLTIPIERFGSKTLEPIGGA